MSQNSLKRLVARAKNHDSNLIDHSFRQNSFKVHFNGISHKKEQHQDYREF